VGLSKPDDAAIWRLDPTRSLVVTTDFFTPVVDDPYDFGSIAAANSISDVYAMGGQPFMALNVAALAPDLAPEVNAEILRGGAEKCLEAEVVIAGGHTIQDNEPKYGLVVIGFVDPKKMLTKGGAQVGDALVLTKPLGFGVTTTALKQQKAAAEDVAEVSAWMKELNRFASELAAELGVASSVRLRIFADKLPFVSCARTYAQMGTFPGGASDNRLYFGKNIKFAPTISEETQMLLFDPQTSGGLLLAVPGDKKEVFVRRAVEIGQPAWIIGEVIDGAGIEVV
jgi:selenide,water dikinase